VAGVVVQAMLIDEFSDRGRHEFVEEFSSGDATANF
jgi:hypothetical protein